MDKIELKPIFGIKKEDYIIPLYTLILLLILFLIFIFDGIKSQGYKVYIDSNVAGASVYVDGIRLGSTPFKGVLKSGNKEIILKKKYYKDVKNNIKIKSQIFFTLFYRKNQKFFYDLELENLKDYSKDTIKDFSLFSLSKDPDRTYHFDSVLYKYISDIIVSEKENKESIKVLQDSVLLMSSKYLIQEVIASSLKYFSKGNILNHNSMLSTIKLILSKNINKIELNKFIKEYYPTFSVDESKEKTDKPFINKNYDILSKYKLNFFKVDNDYYISNLVSNDLFLDFLKDNPEYDIENKDSLIENRIVDNDYLKMQIKDDDLKRPITNISYYIALEFVNWYKKYAKVSLPDSKEWELAAYKFDGLYNPYFLEKAKNESKARKINKNIPSDFLGNTWEFTSSDYKARVFKDNGNNYDFLVKEIRGGSWANMEKEINLKTIGINLVNSTSPFLSLRLVLRE